MLHQAPDNPDGLEGAVIDIVDIDIVDKRIESSG